MKQEMQLHIHQVAEKLADNYKNQGLFEVGKSQRLPKRCEIIELVEKMRTIIYPGFFEDENPEHTSLKEASEDTLMVIYEKLLCQVHTALACQGNETDEQKLTEQAEALTKAFIDKIPEIQDLLLKDVEAEFEGDPAANSKEEIILCYPGMFAIFVYRIAHVLYELKIPFIPRIMTEYAHSETGIDINPGATIGEYFFIDHGTGIVIGETTTIGNHVKIYQGVTLGALSTQKGQALSGVKRHPTIEDNVVIYANTTVLGGETVVGRNSVVAGNTFVTASIPPDTKVSTVAPELKYKNR